jgi:hypothetical protein
MQILHSKWRECALCGEHRGKLSLHHVSKHPRDDLEANLVMLCGDGVSGCHGAVEAGVRETKEELGRYIYGHRPDVIEYLAERKGGKERALAWMERTLGFPY